VGKRGYLGIHAQNVRLSSPLLTARPFARPLACPFGLFRLADLVVNRVELCSDFLHLRCLGGKRLRRLTSHGDGAFDEAERRSQGAL